jgi:hypothetical protein
VERAIMARTRTLSQHEVVKDANELVRTPFGPGDRATVEASFGRTLRDLDLNDRRISAMVRVKNEEEFLFASVDSIARAVDEIVLIDNRSTDGTPEVMEDLARAHGPKVVLLSYPHEIRKVGRETWELASNPSTAHSPHLSSTYYTWCLDRCTKPFVLKWDGDMIARPVFSQALAVWRTSDRPVLQFNGLNVHPNRKNQIRSRVQDRDRLLEKLTSPGLPLWVSDLARDCMEPRLYPRTGAAYDNGKLWTQGLTGPFMEPEVRHRARLEVGPPCFLHLKFCKPDPLSNYSADLGKVIEDNIGLGPELDPEDRALLDRYGLDPRGASIDPSHGVRSADGPVP